ncbi:hypothetical protein HMI54_014258 [Coelomomyces lativittatus]|nr:hypothetical protein HMI54_014258 [Coelomomyces lativittatus]KAJ1517201.1 hypothetical protein HMI55_000381 [Coelomomyces lativittatus]
MPPPSSSSSTSRSFSPNTRRFVLLLTTSLVSFWTLPKLFHRLSLWWPTVQPWWPFTLPHVPKPFTYVGWVRSMVVTLAHQCTLLAYSALIVESMTVDLDPMDFMLDWDDEDEEEEEEEEEEEGVEHHGHQEDVGRFDVRSDVAEASDREGSDEEEGSWVRVRDSQEALNEITQLYPSFTVNEEEEEEEDKEDGVLG